MPLNSSDKIVRLMILALLFMSGVLAANQDVVASWLAGMRLTLSPGVNTPAPVPLYVGVFNDIEGAFTARDAVVEVISANRTTRLDTIIMNGTYTSGTTSLAPGTEIYLHVYRNNRSPNRQMDFYDEWYHAIVGQNQPVMRLRAGLATLGAPAPIGRYDEEHYGKMIRYSSGSAEYWQIAPTFFLSKRDEPEDLGDFKFDLLNPDGASIRSATGLNSASGTPDSAAADFTARTSQFSLKLSYANLGHFRWTYGRPMLFLGPPPEYGWRIGYLVVWVSFNTTGVRATYLTANGWTVLPSLGLTPGYVNFYRVLQPVLGSASVAGSATYDIPVDTGSLPSGTGINVRVWIADLQVPADASRGVSDSIPTPYGGAGGCGITQTISANGFLVSSNKPTGQLIWTAFKTA